jgi:hypothetical protein
MADSTPASRQTFRMNKTSSRNARVQPHPSPADQPDHTAREPRANRYARVVAVAVAAAMVPWCAHLAITLPARTTAEHWSLAWSGLDAAEAVSAGLTALLLRLRRRQASLTAAIGGGLLLVDAWFDVCTAGPGLDQRQALIEAGLVEIPLATIALWFAWTRLES